MNLLSERVKSRTVIVPYLFRILPAVERELAIWRNRALVIPHPELKRQALDSIDKKRFHCQGGSIYALYPGAKTAQIIGFVVALQTISDYLDNLCDRTEATNEGAFRRLHYALNAAIDLDAPLADWYAGYPYNQDGGYLTLLVQECREKIAVFPGYNHIRQELSHLVSLYSDLQVYKHQDRGLRTELLTRWFSRHAELAPNVLWWEFSAAAGSTLGIFVLAASASIASFSRLEIDRLQACYFPWLSGLHILLDYFIDIDEDLRHDELNFVSFYPDEKAMTAGLARFLRESLQRAETLPHAAFHRTVVQGLLALYLSDPKAFCSGRNKISQQLLREGGREARLLHKVCLGLRSAGIV
ncbi:MAG: tetraprenyl-beta-curcumene synthase family protein [Dethiobacter sp.]|jgi:tetraprenyl-beta-curcumene synthase|nr:tetraprenyl-beta-curcumene synthase family protein [Dethiobacter sp.]MBS3902388.1 tetraprenyl-beta-curcumene synthase family protein [Dethiobacter sp.]MBS3990258.1 tetraprenyl-beta-curcumene synthase family protein [Dethiobacter sp.]